MTTRTVAESARTRLISAGVAPSGILTDESQFAAASTLFNVGVDVTPVLLVRCATPEEVQAAVRVATSLDLPLSVLGGGGHDWAGRALREGGLVIDLRAMSSVEIRGDVAIVAGGATSHDLIATAGRSGMTTAAGANGGVGYAGLALGGGYGPLIGRFGLAADNLLGAQVVLADERLVDADDDHEPELFWALRGGGGNFGVVTALRVQLDPAVPLTAGRIAFPLEQAGDVLEGYQELIADCDDDLTVDTALGTTPEGGAMVGLRPTWCGSPEAGAKAIERLAELGKPIMQDVAETSYAAMMSVNDELFGPDHYELGTRSLAGLTPEPIATVAELARSRTSPQTLIAWHHAHGAAGRVPVGDTGFGLRRDHLMVQLIARWSERVGDANRDWVAHGVNALAPHALPGGYANMLGPDRAAQIADAYGPNAARLLAAKAHYDPRTCSPRPHCRHRSEPGRRTVRSAIRSPDNVCTAVNDIGATTRLLDGLGLENVEIAGVRIPNATQVAMSSASASAMRTVFPDPDAFDPVRPDVDQHFAHWPADPLLPLPSAGAHGDPGGGRVAGVAAEAAPRPGSDRSRLRRDGASSR